VRRSNVTHVVLLSVYAAFPPFGLEISHCLQRNELVSTQVELDLSEITDTYRDILSDRP
jgi:hypothetical protein